MKTEATRLLSLIEIGEHINYVAFFLTFSCNLSCPYCINSHHPPSTGMKRKELFVHEWIAAANRLKAGDDLPITLQGGEPTIYDGFYRIVNEVREDIKMDLLTNMTFDVRKFIGEVPVSRFNRRAPYASIRGTYHPGLHDPNKLVRKTLTLMDAGFSVGLYGILHPDEHIRTHILEVQDLMVNKGIDFRTKEFLGEYQGRLYGTFHYKDAILSRDLRHVQCKTTELLIDPSGYVFRCHSDLYQGRNPVASILDSRFEGSKTGNFLGCHFYGDCHPCDIKIKTNRFQINGHMSVEIKMT